MRELRVEELEWISGGAFGTENPVQSDEPGWMDDLGRIGNDILTRAGDIIDKIADLLPDVVENSDTDVNTPDGTRLDCPAGTAPSYVGESNGVARYTCKSI